MERFPDMPERRLREEYLQIVLGKYLRFSVIGGTMIFIAMAYFIYEDHVNGLPAVSVYFRLLPAALSAVFLVVRITPLRKRTMLIMGLYYLCMAGLMAMMSGLLVIAAPTRNYETYVLGTVVVIFCVYLASFYRMIYLIPVYALPLGAAIIAIMLSGSIPMNRMLILSNPVVVAFVCCILTMIQDRVRYSDFRSSRIIEARNITLNQELALATAVQRNILPHRMPAPGAVRVSAEYIPMIGIGGDLYDFFEFREEDAFGLFVCDVSGHGVSAALVSSMVKAHLSTLRSNYTSPTSLLHYINERLVGNIGGHFVTAFYGIYRASERSFTFARAGHCYPILDQRGEVMELKSRGGFLGSMDNVSFEEVVVRLDAGDRLLVYTDGIIEARADRGEIFGEERLIDAIREHRHLDNKEHIDAIIGTVRGFQGCDDFEDDVCIITMQVS
ncbi:MAG: serine/threonine-protein phosphatase [Spirochaetes bacterium]|nr:serine/threonine-protein phosphatase [Spirochaetota bacterium]